MKSLALEELITVWWRKPDRRCDDMGKIYMIGAMKGVDIVRVHNVKLIAKMIRAADVLIKK